MVVVVMLSPVRRRTARAGFIFLLLVVITAFVAAVRHTPPVINAGSRRTKQYWAVFLRQQERQPPSWFCHRNTDHLFDGAPVPVFVLRGGAVHSSIPDLLQRNTQGVIKQTLLDVALPTIAIPATLWFVLAYNIRYALLQTSLTSTTKDRKRYIATSLRQHRLQKFNVLRKSFLSASLFTVIATCLYLRSYPWQAPLWRYGPSPTALGLNFAFWAANGITDSVVDECSGLLLYPTAALAGILQLILIVVLSTGQTRFGHAIFWLKAIEVLLATALAKVIDHPYWVVIALVASGLIAMLATTSQLAPLPPGVKVSGVLAYFGATTLASSGYQLVQNNQRLAEILVSNIQLFRACLGCLSVLFFGTPASWVLYDIINFTMHIGFKVITDTVALEAVSK
jgi:hypothetical protein